MRYVAADLGASHPPYLGKRYDANHLLDKRKGNQGTEIIRGSWTSEEMAGVDTTPVAMSALLKTRRQNASCEQCRKSKKACDGYLVNEQMQGQDSILPCSYCVKTKKDCSGNENWTVAYNGASSNDFPLHGATAQVPPQLDPMVDPWAPVNYQDHSIPPIPNAGWDPNCSLGLSPESTPRASETSSFGGDQYTLNPSPRGDLASQLSSQFALDLSQQEILSGAGYMNTTHYPIEPPPQEPVSQVSYKTRQRVRRRLKNERVKMNHLPQLGQSSMALSAGCNSRLITESFFQIYHDVLENNLAVLLSEDVCPYTSHLRKSHVQYLPAPTTDRDSASPDIPSPGSEPPSKTWSNHVYRRVHDLERAAESVGLISLTRAQKGIAARAMNVCIMTYAAQWSQGTRRKQQPPPDADLRSALEDMEREDEFEQHLQLSLWESAKRILDEAQGMYSFKVIFAEIVFGFVQKPWLAVDPLQYLPDFPDAPDGHGLAIFARTRMQEILSEDECAVYMQRAITKAYALKTRFDQLEAVRAPANVNTGLGVSPDETFNMTWLTEEQRGTVGLVYWLAVMVDTVFSSMNYTPPLIVDKDCQHDRSAASAPGSISPQGNSPAFTDTSFGSDHHWDLAVFAQDDPDRPAAVRWPCSYDDAVKAMAKASVVKILQFKYISYLQDALRSGADVAIIERCIAKAMKARRYWNRTYAVLCNDLIRDYDNIPVRIKSWFPFISIHWHLCTLLLADLIDVIDGNGLGSEAGLLSRGETNLSARLRATSSTALAELASVTTSSADNMADSAQLPDFHFAISEGAALTEPWTLLIIKAFAEACCFHLGVLEDTLGSMGTVFPGVDEDGRAAAVQHARACVKALWFLGRRSESARNLSLLFGWVIRKMGSQPW